MMFFLLLAKKEEVMPSWHPNKQNLTFEQMMERARQQQTNATNDPTFVPTLKTENPMLEKIESKWLEDPQKYRKQLEQIRLEGESKLDKSYQPSNSNSSDPMLRLNAFIRPACQFNEVDGHCKIVEISEDPEHCSLGVVKFLFEEDQQTYQMQHRYRNPYLFWIKMKDLKLEDEFKCTKLEKIAGDACNTIEWDFPKLDWN